MAFPCDKCGTKLSTLKILNSHKKSGACERALERKPWNDFLASHDGDPTCKICKNSFVNITKLGEHYKDSKCGEEFGVRRVRQRAACPKCKKMFANVGAMNLHLNSDACNTPRKCDGCGLLFRNKPCLFAHVRAGCLKPADVTCKICGLVRATISGLNYHMLSHVREKDKIKCDFCKTSHRDMKSYHLHLESRGHQALANPHNKDLPEVPIDCQLCGRIMPSDGKLGLHHLLWCHDQLISGTLDVAQDKMISCSVCKKVVPAADYGLHMHKHIAPDANSFKFKCEECNIKFLHEECVQVHKLLHMTSENYDEEKMSSFLELAKVEGRVPKKLNKKDEEKHDCSICGVLVGYGAMDRHLRGHKGEIPYYCMDCDHVCSSARNLNSHLREKHSKAYAQQKLERKVEREKKIALLPPLDPSYFPPVPDEVREENIAKMHEEWNKKRGPKPKRRFNNKCKECDIGFQTYENLQKHMEKYHDPNRKSNFKCRHCIRKFKSIELLTLHEAELPCQRVCKICEKSGFKTTAEFEMHQNSPHVKPPPPKLFYCARCEGSTDTQKEMMTHVQEKHGLVFTPEILGILEQKRRENDARKPDCSHNFKAEAICYLCSKKCYCSSFVMIHTELCEKKLKILSVKAK